MEIEIRPENENDHSETEALTREAFWDVYKPGCDEHLVLHNMRHIPAFIPELDFVAVYQDRIIGHIIYSKAKVIDQNDLAHDVLSMGPVSVLPEYQGKGIGSQLIKHSTAVAAKMGFNAVIIFGNPEYYSRFGFKNAEKYNITTSQGDNFDAFMALELYEDSLKGVEGRFHEDPVFHVDEKELVEFEKRFPFREKHVTDTQL